MMIDYDRRCEWCDGEGRFRMGKRRQLHEECNACGGTGWKQASNDEEARAKIDYIISRQTRIVDSRTRSTFLKRWRELGLLE